MATEAPSEPHKRSVAEEPVTSVLPGGDVPFDPTHDFNADEEVLAALGYKSEFKREFSLFTTFCVSFAVLGLLPSFASTLYVAIRRDTNTARLTLFQVLWYGICGNRRYDMGLDRSDAGNPVCCVEYGRVVQLNANQRRTILCFSRASPSRIWTIRSLVDRLE